MSTDFGSQYALLFNDVPVNQQVDNAPIQRQNLALIIDREQRVDRQRKLRIILYFVIVVVCIVLAASIFVIVSRMVQAETDTASGPLPAYGRLGAVASEHPTCTEIGLQILKDGGNAVDSAVATAICIGTLNSFSSGIGGGGFLTVRLNSTVSKFIDFRETAPAAATERMYNANGTSSTRGGLAVAVPGEVAGLWMAHSSWGRLPWADLFTPSINLARNGFTVNEIMASRIHNLAAYVSKDSPFASIFFNANGNPLTVGQTVYRTNYSKTLEAVAKDHSSFYKGPIAQHMIDEIQKSQGIMTMQDLANYSARMEDPLVGWYNGLKIITGPPPSSGAILISILNILERYQFSVSGMTGLNLHRMIEAFKHGFAQRTELGDPAFLPANNSLRVAEFISKEYAAQIRAQISDSQTYPVDHYHPQFDTIETPGTTHISVVDSARMAVSMTSTVNLGFGAKLMNRETGIILNNEMDDFSSPNITNAFGLRPSKNNFIEPGKRPLSSCVPTIIERDGELAMAIGASGGSRIITATVQGILNVLDFNMNIQESISAKRVHDQLIPEVAFIEQGYSDALVHALIDRGHNITITGDLLAFGDVQGVYIPEGGILEAGADPRKQALALAY